MGNNGQRVFSCLRVIFVIVFVVVDEKTLTALFVTCKSTWLVVYNTKKEV